MHKTAGTAALVGLAAWTGGAILVAGAAAPRVAVADAAAMPSGKDLLAAHLAAIGGEKAVRARTSRVMKGSFSMPSMGFTGEMSVTQMAPHYQLSIFTITGMGEVRQGFDGDTAWMVNPFMGAQIDDSVGVEAQRMRNAFYKELTYTDRFTTIETVEKTNWRGEDSWKVRLVDAEGKETFEFFSVATGLRRGEMGTEPTPGGDVESITVFEEYKDFGGIKTPTKITNEAAGQTQIFTVASVEWDTVDKAVFALPDEVKALKTP